MHHLPDYINQDIKRRKNKDMDSTANKTEYRSKRNPTGKPQILSISDGSGFSRLFWTVAPRQLRQYQKFVDRVIPFTPFMLLSKYGKTCLKRSLKIDKSKVLKEDGSFMQVESIAECSLGAFCNTFDPH